MKQFLVQFKRYGSLIALPLLSGVSLVAGNTKVGRYAKTARIALQSVLERLP